MVGIHKNAQTSLFDIYISLIPSHRSRHLKLNIGLVVWMEIEILPLEPKVKFFLSHQENNLFNLAFAEFCLFCHLIDSLRLVPGRQSVSIDFDLNSFKSEKY